MPGHKNYKTRRPLPKRPPATRVGRPWSFQIELTEGCNKYCTFCGLRSIRPGVGDYKLMTRETAELAAVGCASLNPDARYEFAAHGEPLMHPRRQELISMFRQHLPKAQMQVTTNGKVLRNKMQERVEELFDAGIDFIILDTYEPERFALQVEASNLKPPITVLDFYDEMAPKGISPWHNHHRKLRNTVIIMDDLGTRSGESKNRVISNHAGNSKLVPPLAEPMMKVCTIPFRELTVSWNGDVCICCNDWGHEMVTSNIHQRPMAGIWWGPEFEAIRRVLRSNNRGFNPCVRCDYSVGARVGLLPRYAPPTAEDAALLRSVIAASPRNNGFPIDVRLGALES